MCNTFAVVSVMQVPGEGGVYLVSIVILVLDEFLLSMYIVGLVGTSINIVDFHVVQSCTTTSHVPSINASVSLRRVTRGPVTPLLRECILPPLRMMGTGARGIDGVSSAYFGSSSDGGDGPSLSESN